MPDPQLAMSSAAYPVTAGDVYQLSFIAGSTPVTYAIVVDTTYKIKVANFAVLDITGKTFLDVKSQVESIVSKNYPLSGAQFILKSPATFYIVTNGEVEVTAELKAWGLSRLSSVIKPVLTHYASVRDVTVTSSIGKKTTYDLFKATRFGDLSEDPYVRPGDVVTVNKVKRQVTLEGAVSRPGIYQLLDGEGLGKLISVYGGGMTPLSDPSRLEIVRYIGSTEVSGTKIILE